MAKSIAEQSDKPQTTKLSVSLFIRSPQLFIQNTLGEVILDPPRDP